MTTDTRELKLIAADGTACTLWVEKKWPDGWMIGWCPERQANIYVHESQVVGDER